MIIAREFAEGLNKRTLADLASAYATEFASLLGRDEPVEIESKELIFERGEALNVFLKKYDPKKVPKFLRKLTRALYYNKRAGIKEGNAFVQEGVAYIPVTELCTTEEVLVRSILSEPVETRLFQSVIAFFSRTKSPYVSIQGFGSEIAHLTGNRFYGAKAHTGLGEALDAASQTLELSKDVAFLCSGIDLDDTLEVIVDRYLASHVQERKRELEVYEALLLVGNDAAREKIIEHGLCNQKMADTLLYAIKRDYVMTHHFEGVKTFFEVLDSVDGNIQSAYRKLGEIMDDPAVVNTETALRALGYCSERLLRYQGFLESGMTEKARIIHLID